MTDTIPDIPTATFWGTVWAKIKAVLRWVALKFAAPGVALLIIVGAVILVSLGCKDLQIGGLLGKLFGKKPDAKADPNVVNTIPSDRVDPNGKIIPQGTPDSKGDTQAVVVPIQHTGGLLEDPKTVTITPPGTTTPMVIQLPDGVRAKDVDQIVVVTPGQYVVTVKDTSGVAASTIDDLLTKYGS